MAKIAIQQATEKDLNEVASMAWSLYTGEGEWLIKLNAANRTKNTEQVLELIKSGGVLIAKIGKSPAGFLMHAPRKNSMEMAFKESVLIDLYVKPEFRRKGVGEALTRAYLSEIKAKGFNRASLNVFSDNGAARKLYEKDGFHKIIDWMVIDLK